MRIWLALVAALAPVSAVADTITAARFIDPTDRYGHGVLGDAIEWGGLEIVTSGSRDDAVDASAVARTTTHTYTFRLPLDHVFEDIEPRLWDVTGDGLPEVVVIETDAARGAALAIYTQEGKLVETPHIGQRNRWLAPIGAADLDGDGYVEIAYIDRPHLVRTLRVWRYDDGKLSQVAHSNGTEFTGSNGLTNHRIGQDFISGGAATCDGTSTLFTVNGDWTLVIASQLQNGAIVSAPVGQYEDRASLDKFLRCP